MVVVFVVFVDLFRKPLILLTFLDFGLVDRLWFLRVVLWSCGSLVVFGTRVAHCVSEAGKATRSGINQGGMRVPCAKRTACKIARVAPTNRHKNRKSPMMWFLGELVVFGEIVVFGTRVAHCVSETGKATRSGINQRGMREARCAKRTACKIARVAPTPPTKTAKAL